MELLSFYDYQKACLRTESPFPADLKPLDEFTYRLQHGAIGVITEAGELFDALVAPKLDDVNVNEEIGDGCWYAGLLCEILGQDFNKIVNQVSLFNPDPKCDNYSNYASDAKKDCLHLAVAKWVRGAGMILDQCKRKVYYRTRSIKSVTDPFAAGLSLEYLALVQAGSIVKIPYEIDRNVCVKGLELIVSGLYGASNAGFGEDLSTICTKNILKLARRYGDKFNEFGAVTRNLEAERKVLESQPKA